MRQKKWRSKPLAIVRPKRGQKGQVARFCGLLHVMNRQLSVELLASIFGISPALIYRTMATARPAKCGATRIRPAKSDEHGRHNGHDQHVIGRIPTIMPATIPAPVEISPADLWAAGEILVHQHGVETVFDKLIVPAIS